jgi:hypothetical protein
LVEKANFQEFSTTKLTVNQVNFTTTKKSMFYSAKNDVEEFIFQPLMLKKKFGSKNSNFYSVFCCCCCCRVEYKKAMYVMWFEVGINVKKTTYLLCVL